MMEAVLQLLMLPSPWVQWELPAPSVHTIVKSKESTQRLHAAKMLWQYTLTIITIVPSMIWFFLSYLHRSIPAQVHLLQLTADLNLSERDSTSISPITKRSSWSWYQTKITLGTQRQKIFTLPCFRIVSLQQIWWKLTAWAVMWIRRQTENPRL